MADINNAAQEVILTDEVKGNSCVPNAAGQLPVLAGQTGTWTVGITGTVPVSGTFYQATQPISATALPLPSGASTEASLAKLTVSQGTALGTNTQALVGGSVTTAAPTYTTGQISPLSLDTAGALRVNATVTASGSTTPTISNVTCTNANTEYSQALPANCKRFFIQLRTVKDLKVSFTSGQSGTTYFTVPAGGQYAEDSLLLTARTLYFQSTTAGVVAEIVAWV